MKVLLDTNILLRLDDVAHAQHHLALAAVERISACNRSCVIVPQVLYEYWVVATRPVAVNGLGLDVAHAERVIDDWIRFFPVLLDERGIFTHWRTLVVTHAVQGKNAHDARLAAAMQRHQVTELLTFNAGDFKRFPNVRAWTPSDVLSDSVAL